MWGLAYKDLLLMRRSLWYYAFLLVIFTAFVLIGSLDAYILSGMAMLFSYMVPLSSFSLDEAARWGSSPPPPRPAFGESWTASTCAPC